MTIVARTEATLAQTAEEIGARAGGTWVACDITTPEGRAAALAACPDPDILVTNAGGPPPGDFRDWDRDAWIRALDANMLTPIELIKATVDGMIARKFGRIVNITSSAVKAPIDVLGLSNGARAGSPVSSPGSRARSRAHSVTINNLLPGNFDTDRMRTTMRGARQGRRQDAREVVAAARDGDSGRPLRHADEFGAVCAFLCSVHAGYIVGQNILLDGGNYPGTSSSSLADLPDDRPLLLDHAQRAQDHDLPRGDRASVRGQARSTSARASSSTRRSSRSRPTTASRRSSITRRPTAARRCRCSSRARSCSYLAGKTGRFYPADLRGRCDVAQWLFWQMGGLGPMAGQNHHFALYAPEKIPYAIDRYVQETGRLYRVLDKRLADREFIAGDYSHRRHGVLSVGAVPSGRGRTSTSSRT